MKFLQLLIWLLLPAAMFSQQAVFKEISALKSQGAYFEQMDLFNYQHSNLSDYDINASNLSKADFLELDLAELRRAKANKYDQILVELHGLNGEAFTLELTQTKVLSDNFNLFTSSNPNEAVPYEGGLHYKGIVQGDPNSLVVISMFHEHITGMIANQAGNYVIAQMKDRGLIHILYNDRDLDGVLPGDCEMMDDGKGYKAKDLVVDPNKSPGDCIQLYIEIDDDIVSNKGGGTAATAYIEGMFAQSIILYANDGLTLEISEIYAWTTSSPYSGGSSSAMLSSYQSNTGTFNGDLSHLVSYKASGGIAAGFSGICNSNPDLSKCFSSVDGSYANVPTYSWSVMVVTHEMGHLIGSRHTHACVWNGNNTAIDGCSGSTEGSCSLPPNPSEGGTIMSYCHLTSVGINLNLGFGPQPQAVVQNTVINATCLGSCGGPSCSNGIQDGDETGVDCGGSVCQPCPTCTDGIQNGDETGIDCGGSTCPACPPSYCSSSGNDQSYEFIDAVQLSTINNTSGNDGGYGDYTSLTGDLDAGSTYTITLTPGFAGSSYTENWRVWIDYNVDYDFDDAGELVAEGASSTTQNIAFTVPSLSSSVITRMRVSMQYNSYPPNCGTFTYGEVEDYTVEVTVPSGPTCTDGIQNGDETGVDCGGAVCPPCPTCTDGIQNGDETGVDCGGSTCPACPTCTDGIQNGDETGVDCGGSNCPACPSCTDGIQNGDETGIDCGGTLCPACPTCTDGIQNGDETGIDCGGATCPACPTCTDGIQNGNETGVDCGGSCPPCGGCNYQTIDFENFDSGWGIWNDGGSDCRKSSKDAAYAYSGNYPVRLRDNTSTSTMTTDNLDLSAYDELTVDFTYIARSMDNGNEDFWLQVSTNGGSTYTTVEEWNKGDEFENNVREFDAVVIPGPFTSTTKLRFRCDASGNSDWVYIDDVDITGCYNASALREGDDEDIVIEENTLDIEQFRKVQLFPNPAGYMLNVKFVAEEEGPMKATILDLTGNPVLSQDFENRTGSNEIQLELDRVGNGMYLLQLSNDSQRIVKRFFVVK